MRRINKQKFCYLHDAVVGQECLIEGEPFVCVELIYNANLDYGKRFWIDGTSSLQPNLKYQERKLKFIQQKSFGKTGLLVFTVYFGGNRITRFDTEIMGKEGDISTVRNNLSL